ncbi:isoleucine--tRNA ligase [Candidatus Woesearchaeota archaeon]|nr:isoleucine--tRNA ligase [Candidatus Woesearchaeota archaeon]MBW3005961.1 isoleucine--tRNA ligase [Candidatus Woesearchaeota archaeon]
MQYNKDIEPEVLKFWEANDIYEKVKARNKGKEKFYFLQGPPYTSGRLHIAHAWNNSAKDVVMRYKRMRGFDVWDRAGYDMHGLPTENAVMKKLGLKTKEEIAAYGVDKFVKECIKFSSDNALLMDKDLWRVGVWMDYDKAYWPIKKYYIEGEWWLIKKAHEEKRLYKGKKVMTWCASCETALAKHELEYETDQDNSIFLKFQVEDKPNEYLIIWTTTPWTIPYNLAVMVNPELDYVKAEVDGETWIVSKALVNVLIKGLTDKDYKIIEEFKGTKLEGLHYKHPMIDEIKSLQEVKKSHKNTHSVIMSTEYVDVTAGSGLVHCAPGCGPEDYEVGMEYDLPAYNNLNERGIFEDMGPYDGKQAKVDDKFFIEKLKDMGVLIEVTPVEHEYAHCWRCHKPVVFRATTQWFMKVEDLREKLIDENKDVFWVPGDFSKRYDNWMDNLKDNSITRQRFWGCPVPIWECEKCGNVTVIGSEEELRSKSVDNKVPEDLHRPWIDDIKIKCKCGEEVSRIPDVVDVWIDSGTASWNCLEYPANKEHFEKWWPADFILEASEQVRLWYSMLNICSTIAFGKKSYDAVYSHGMILDWQGTKMSKSLGNIVSPYEVIDKYSADILRYYMNETTAGENINFNWESVKIKQRNLTVLWNIHKLVINLAKELGVDPETLEPKEDLLGIEEKFMLSRLNSTIKQVTDLFEVYQIDKTITLIEKLFLDLSRMYIQLTRDKASVGTPEEKEVVLYTVYQVLFETIKMFNVIAPFINEKMYLNFKEVFDLQEESVNLLSWPEAEEEFVDEEVEKNMNDAFLVVQSILNAREKAGLGVRWPVKAVEIVTKDEGIKLASDTMDAIIMRQTNVKEINTHEEFPVIKKTAKLNIAPLKESFNDLAPKIIAKFGTESTKKIADNLEKKGKVELTVEAQKVTLLPEHVILDRQVPDNFIEVEVKGGFIYLDKTRTDELDAEGYARESMRRVQAARKKAGLQKVDTISLYLKVDDTLAKMLESWSKQIKEKCGAVSIKISTEPPAKKMEFESQDNIKGKTLEIFFDKV